MSEVGGIQYALSPDGTSIAYQWFGDGPPVVRTPALMGALRLIGTVDERSGSAAAALPGRSVVRYDRRGIGYSDRSARDFSIEAASGDLGAVLDALSGEPVVIGATWDHGPVAIRYVAENPDRVSHLIRETTFARGRDLMGTTSSKIVKKVLREDWDYFLKVISRVEVNLDRPQSDHWEEIAREEMSVEVIKAWFTAIEDYDATDWLEAITTPTLVVQRSRNAVDMQALASLRDIATRIPGATLVRGDGAQRRDAVTQFLGAGTTTEELGTFRTVMFTDLVSSTALTQQLGDDLAHETVELHDSAVRDALALQGGIEIKHTGDGIMASFGSATAAARSASDIVATLAAAGVAVRIGLNAGEPLERDGDLFGTVVQLCARVCDAARSGEVLATQVIRDITAGKGIEWGEGTMIRPKGFDLAVKVFSLAVAPSPR